MAGHFYHYTSPSQLEGHHWQTPPNKAEIATAVDDVTCKAKTDRLNTWLAVEAAYQQALIGQNLATLSQPQANFAPLLHRANTAACGTGTTLRELPLGCPGRYPLTPDCAGVTIAHGWANSLRFRCKAPPGGVLVRT
jgi:hypothetical protein